MKTITIGDVHGSERWKFLLFGTVKPTQEIIQQTMLLYDKVIFVGDYCDSFDNDVDIVKNLLEIIELKKNYDDKVILLWGNHDVFYYTLNYRDNCTGNRLELIPDLNQIFSANYKLFQFSYQYKNYIWTHAGIHRGWWNHYVLPKINGKIESRFHKYLTGDETISDILNMMFDLQDETLFMVSHLRMKNGIGGKPVGGPLWASFVEIYKKPLLGYHQIFGHTHKDTIKHYKSTHFNYSVTNVDCLSECDSLYKIEI